MKTLIHVRFTAPSIAPTSCSVLPCILEAHLLPILLIPQVSSNITALTPFHSDHTGTLYNSQTARYTSTFGYTYPEIIDWNVTPTQLSSNVRRSLNALLNPTGTINTENSGSQQLQKREKQTISTSAYYANAADHQYFINIRVDT